MNKIKYLRGVHNLTQQELAKYLNVTRSSVNAWEMDITKPSTSEIIMMSMKFMISTEYFLYSKTSESILLLGLTDDQKKVMKLLIKCYQK